MKPVSLRLKNFFSHKDSFIDLTGMSSCLLIGNKEGDYSKSNGSGKSAIFEAIPWVLFNNSRSSSRDDNIRWGQNSCKVEIIFEHKDDIYKVVRERFRKNSTSNVFFFRENSIGEWTDLSGETATVTNKNICAVLGMDYKTFLNTVYFRQNDISEFSEAEPGRKKDIIKNIVDISKWDVYERQAKDKLKEYKIKNSILSEEMESFELIESEHLELKIKMKEEALRLEKVKGLRDKYTKEYESILEEYLIKESSLDTNLYDKTLEKISYLSGMIDKNEELLVKEKSFMDDLLEKNSKVTKYIENAESSISHFVEEIDLDLKIQDARMAIVELKSDFKYKKISLENISEDLGIDDICQSCFQPVSKDHMDRVIKDRVHKRKMLSNDLRNISKVISEKEKSISGLEMNLAEREKIDKIKVKLSGAKEKSEFFASKIHECQENISVIKDRVSSFQKKKKEEEALLESLRDVSFSDLKLKLKRSKEKKIASESEEFSLNKNIGAIEQSLKNLEDRISEYKKKKEEISRVQNKINIYSKLSRYLGKNGVQTILLNNFIEDLEDECNRVLANIGLPIAVIMETQSGKTTGKIKETLDIKIRKDGHYHSFESLSGGEKAKIALSLRFALSSLSSRYSDGEFQFLMLDEINSPLDRDGVENLMVSVINSLEKNLLVLMITHDESLKENFNNILDVTKVNGESFVSLIKT